MESVYFRTSPQIIIDLLLFKNFYLTPLDDDGDRYPTQRWKWCIDADYKTGGSLTLAMFVAEDPKSNGEEARLDALKLLDQIEKALQERREE